MITGYCIIRDQIIVIDGKTIAEGGTGKLTDFLEQTYVKLGIDYPKFYKMDTLSKLGFLAAEVLIRDHPVTGDESVAVILSNAHASLDTDIRYAESAKSAGSPALFVYTLPNIVAGEICIRHKIKGENAFFITPSFDVELIVSYAELVLSRERSSNAECPVPDASLCGWIDVIGEHHDVFLYLVEKNKRTSLEHTAEQLKELYHREVWNN